MTDRDDNVGAHPRDDYPPGVTIDQVTVPASCRTCRHRHLGALGCDAFDVIPVPIITGAVAHTAPYPGDHGIRYEPGTPQPVRPPAPERRGAA